MAKSTICTIEGCGKLEHSRGLCHMHYRRWRLNGDPLVVHLPRSAGREWLEAHRDHDGPDCLSWPFWKNIHGYGMVHRYANKVATTAARLMCEMVNGPPPSNEHQAAHSCGQGHKGCVNPKHLRWATIAENERDKLVHGTLANGEKHYLAKLTNEKVAYIRERAGFVTHAALASELGVSQAAVWKVIHRQSWKDAP